MVPEHVKSAAKQVSEFLTKKGIAHAVIGGMAVSAFSPPRMTEDVDFLVPESALDTIRELGEVTPLSPPVDGVTVKMGDGEEAVDVDFVFMPEDMPEETLEGGTTIDGIPVLRPEALLLMKMHAPRAKDHADVIEMLKGDLVDRKAVRAYIKKHDPSMLDDFDSNVTLADFEKSGKAKPKKK
jgi:hypothetical protein